MTFGFQDALTFLLEKLPAYHRLGAPALRPGLENIKTLCDWLGNPQEKYQTIHVAGTNGKGSTSHMLAALLQSAGYKTGLLTSPHLISYRERIKINGREIDESYVVEFVQKFHKAQIEGDFSFFEISTALAFQYFADCKVDIAVIETGLGGTFDSTNIIKPILSVITNIDYDHKHLLGNSLAEIAEQKAGIIKAERPVVVGRRNKETDSVFSNVAEAKRSPIIFSSDVCDLILTEEGARVLFLNTDTQLFFKPQLKGHYQYENFQTVGAAFLALKEQFRLTTSHLLEALTHVVELTGLRGRYETLSNRPHIVCDVAHNPDGLEAVFEQAIRETVGMLHIVVGVVADKKVAEIAPLFPQSAKYYITQPSVERAMEASKLAESLSSRKLKIQTITFTVAEALSNALDNADADDLILITGSTFVVADAIRFLEGI